MNNRVQAGLSCGVILLLNAGCAGDASSDVGSGDETVGSVSEQLLALTYRRDVITAPDGASVVNANDINDRGQVLGTSVSGESYGAFIWSARSGYTTLVGVPDAFTTATALNDHGSVAGSVSLSDGSTRPALWPSPNEVQILEPYGRYVFESPTSSWSVDAAIATDINDRGHVVGWTSAPDYAQVAYLWSAGDGMQLLGTLGGPTSTADAINARDEVVGTSELADGTRHAFLWADGEMLDLGALSGSYSQAYAINDLGVVTGIYQTPSSETRVFRWSRARGAVDVGPTYEGVDEGITSLSTDINLFGQIVGGVKATSDSSVRAAVRQPFTGNWQELSPDWPYPSFALAINSIGTIVGGVATSAEPDAPSLGVIWTPVLTRR